MVGEISCALVTEKPNDDVGNVGSGGEYCTYLRRVRVRRNIIVGVLQRGIDE